MKYSYNQNIENFKNNLFLFIKKQFKQKAVHLKYMKTHYLKYLFSKLVYRINVILIKSQYDFLL